MGLINYGTQTISFAYNEQAKSEKFNKLNYKLFPDGIYEGGLLTYSDTSTVNLAPLTLFVNDSVTKVGIKISTEVSVPITVGVATPYIVIRYTWLNAANNYADIEAVSFASLTVDDIVVGRCTYNSSNVLQTTFDYGRRTVSSITASNDVTDNLKIVAQEPYANTAYVDAGTALIKGVITPIAGTSTAVISATTLGRIDLVYISEAGVVSVLEGVDAGSPVVPDSPDNSIMLGVITRGVGETIIRGDQITNFTFDRESSASTPPIDTDITMGGATPSDLLISSQKAIKTYADTLDTGYTTPIGSVIPYAHATTPTGYLNCDGSSYSITTYSDLFNIIGYTYGGSLGNFNVPDYRGVFLRGSGTHGSMVKADGTPFDGGAIGAENNDKMQQLTGDYLGYGVNNNDVSRVGTGNGVFSEGTPAATGTAAAISGTLSSQIVFDSADSPNARTGDETSPANVAVNYIIRATNVSITLVDASEYTASTIPIGTSVSWHDALAPAGYVKNDGTSYLRTAYSDLFASIGTTYGSVDATHFNVPKSHHDTAWTVVGSTLGANANIVITHNLNLPFGSYRGNIILRDPAVPDKFYRGDVTLYATTMYGQELTGKDNDLNSCHIHVMESLNRYLATTGGEITIPTTWEYKVELERKDMTKNSIIRATNTSVTLEEVSSSNIADLTVTNSATFNAPSTFNDTMSSPQTCKAFVNFAGGNVGGFCTIGDSYNVASVIYNSVASYTINFTTPMSNVYFSESIKGSLSGYYCIPGRSTKTVSSIQITIGTYTGSSANSIALRDITDVNIQIFGT